MKIYGAEIPKAINTAKSTSTGKSIFEFDKNSPVANAYNNLAKEVLENERTRQKMVLPKLDDLFTSQEQRDNPVVDEVKEIELYK